MSSAARFFQVIQARDTAAVKRMLAAEPELATARNEKGQSALLLTIYGGNKELRDTLLESGAPLEVHEAAALGDLERVKHLVEKEPVLANGYSPLLTAAANGHLGIASILLASGADLHAQSNDGKTARRIAEERGHPAVAEFLRDSGAK